MLFIYTDRIYSIIAHCYFLTTVWNWKWGLFFYKRCMLHRFVFCSTHPTTSRNICAPFCRTHGWVFRLKLHVLICCFCAFRNKLFFYTANSVTGHLCTSFFSVALFFAPLTPTLSMPMVDPEFMVEKRTTSAGYRLPITSRPRSSEFHQNCIPAEHRQRAQVATSTNKSQVEEPCDVVTQDTIWKQSVNKERTRAKQW